MIPDLYRQPPPRLVHPVENHQPLTELARAKVNLGLRILGRRADGFHELESVVVFADVGDRVQLTPGAPPLVTTSGPFAEAISGENLAARTLATLAATHPQLRLGAIAIDKQLPVAAGLGGGSADAAAVLRLIRRANAEQAVDVDWYALAASLGSDVPVCFGNAACRMTGRGERLAPIAPMPPLPAVLVNPCVAVPADKTRQVFAELAAPPYDPSRRASDALIAPRPSAPPSSFGGDPAVEDYLYHHLFGIQNDLAIHATAVIPAIADVLAALEADTLPHIVQLSGAGPTCFALCVSMNDAEAVARRMAAKHRTWWVRPAWLN